MKLNIRNGVFLPKFRISCHFTWFYNLKCINLELHVHILYQAKVHLESITWKATVGKTKIIAGFRSLASKS